MRTSRIRYILKLTSFAGITGTSFYCALQLPYPKLNEDSEEGKKIIQENVDNKNMLAHYTDEVRQKWISNWDRREPMALINKKKYESALPEEKAKMLEEVTPKAVRNIFLIRHGQYNLDAEEDEKRLTQLGREQATLLGKRLAEASERFNFQRCTFSTMIRAKETGELVARELPYIGDRCKFDLMLEEGPPYPPEPNLKHWRPMEHKFYEKGARIEAAFRKYFHRASPKQTDDSYELVVGHANVIRYFVCRALQYPPEGWLRISLAHTSITWLVILPDGRVILKALGDFGHLPPEKLSFQ